MEGVIAELQTRSLLALLCATTDSLVITRLSNGNPTVPTNVFIVILCWIMHGESGKLWCARNGDPKLHKDKNLTKVMLKTKNTTDLHSEHNQPLYPAELGCESGNRRRGT